MHLYLDNFINDDAHSSIMDNKRRERMLGNKNHFIHGMSQGSKFKCQNCEKEGIRNRYKQKYCNTKCQLEFEYRTGKRDPYETSKAAHEAIHARTQERWEKGEKSKYISKRGYYIIYHPQLGKIKEHHWIWQQHKGPIPIGHVVHHKNGNKLDNRIENLQLMINSDHHKLHYSQRKKDLKGRLT